MPLVSIGVYGIFHYHNTVERLDRKGLLRQFFCATKRKYKPDFAEAEFRNPWPIAYAEALNNRALHLLPEQCALTWSHSALDSYTRAHLQPCRLFHCAHHGVFLRTIEHVRSRACHVLGDAVNSHPEHMGRLLSEEYERLQLGHSVSLTAAQERMLQELPSFDFLLAPSNFVKRSYQQRGCPDNKIAVLPFGVDHQFFARLRDDISQRPFKVIYVAQIIPRKAHIDLLEAWKILRLPHAELVFVGAKSREMEPVLKPYAGCYSHVGTVSWPELRNLLNSASVFVMPSIEEGCAYSALEAMACGLPVILSENTGAAEVIEHGRSGFVVPIRAPERMAEHIEALYRQPSLRASMGGEARQVVKTRCDWDRYTERLIDIYNCIIEGKAAS